MASVFPVQIDAQKSAFEHQLCSPLLHIKRETRARLGLDFERWMDMKISSQAINLKKGNMNTHNLIMIGISKKSTLCPKTMLGNKILFTKFISFLLQSLVIRKETNQLIDNNGNKLEFLCF